MFSPSRSTSSGEAHDADDDEGLVVDSWEIGEFSILILDRMGEPWKMLIFWKKPRKLRRTGPLGFRFVGFFL